MSTAIELMLETARRGELHHAVILHGPSPALLRDLAVRLAKTLNCQQGSTGDDCLSCQRIDRRVHPDVHFTTVEGERKQISIEQIRDLVAGATLRPFEGRTKVFIVEPAEALSISGSNSLLKTLEEPARDTTFLLLARSPDLLLPTIRSRSQSIYIGDTSRPLTGPLQSQRIRQLALVDEADEMAGQLLDLLHRYATRGESAALLAAASLVSAWEPAKDGLAILGAVLCDAVGLDPTQSLDPKKLDAVREAIPRDRLLAAADATLAAIRSLTVNADARLVAEQALAALVV